MNYEIIGGNKNAIFDVSERVYDDFTYFNLSFCSASA